MSKKYSTSKKEKLVERIGKLQTKDEYVKLYKIIQKKNKNKPTKQVGDTTVMFFHDLDNETYQEIEKYLDKTLKKYENDSKNSDYTEEYKPYSQDEFPDEKEISPKLKYSNREKNIIKRKRYDQTLTEENGSDVKYCNFNVENLSEK